MRKPKLPSDDTNQGHRKRLRERFIRSGLDGFQDYEVIELLLVLGTPRRDCKSPAKEAIKRFQSLRGVLAASPEELQQIPGVGPHNTIAIKLVHEVARRFLKEKLIDRPVYQSAQEIFDYLYHSMRDLKKEVFRVIYLNSQNQIIEIADLFEGTVNLSVVHPREVMEAALKYHAVSLIFVHNHPSGNPQPSQNDREVTRDLVYAASPLQIKVLDHIVIGDNTYFSFAGEGLIEKYALDFLGVKAKQNARVSRRNPGAGRSP
jgi:DNA repair protein RadC